MKGGRAQALDGSGFQGITALLRERGLCAHETRRELVSRWRKDAEKLGSLRCEWSRHRCIERKRLGTWLWPVGRDVRMHQMQDHLHRLIEYLKRQVVFLVLKMRLTGHHEIFDGLRYIEFGTWGDIVIV